MAFGSTNRLQWLRIANCYQISGKGLCDVANKLPELEELDITSRNLTKESLEAIGRCCPLLKSLKLNVSNRRQLFERNEDAFAIAETMSGLRRLQIIGSKMTDDGLLAILDGCPDLESLDLQECWYVKLEGSLSKRCAEQIKDLRIPYEYPSQDEIDYRLLYDDYSSGLSDVDFLFDDHFSGPSDFSDLDYDSDQYNDY